MPIQSIGDTRVLAIAQNPLISYIATVSFSMYQTLDILVAGSKLCSNSI